MSLTGSRDVEATKLQKPNPLTTKTNIICTVTHCLSITEQFTFGRRYPVISLPEQGYKMLGGRQVIFKNCKRATLGYCCHRYYKEETTYKLVVHASYVYVYASLLGVDRKLFPLLLQIVKKGVVFRAMERHVKETRGTGLP